jgi:hypothetical protein
MIVGGGGGVEDAGVDVFVAVDHAVDSEVFFDMATAVGAVDGVDLANGADGLVDGGDEKAGFAVGDDFSARAAVVGDDSTPAALASAMTSRSVRAVVQCSRAKAS